MCLPLAADLHSSQLLWASSRLHLSRDAWYTVRPVLALKSHHRSGVACCRTPEWKTGLKEGNYLSYQCTCPDKPESPSAAVACGICCILRPVSQWLNEPLSLNMSGGRATKVYWCMLNIQAG
ncbi:hypothetical protein V5799_027571 [Amblyomma americanum]|uniref:Uncharacterized protein n=1 Tax=Amblyomma americanum TaxID=6943 RepID=A0AAQ4DFB6_AMBAM